MPSLSSEQLGYTFGLLSMKPVSDGTVLLEKVVSPDSDGVDIKSSSAIDDGGHADVHTDDRQ